MKKIACVWGCLALCSLVLFGCKDESENLVLKRTATLRLSENHGRDYPTTLADEEFARLVEEETGGRIKIEVRSGGALSQNEGDAIEALKYGDLAFTRVSATSVAAYVDEINALQFPYLYKNSEHMWKVLNGKVGQEILEGIEKSGSGLVGLCYYDAGARNFYLKKPVRSVKDMKGLKIRVLNSQLMIDMCDALGAKGITGLNMTQIRGAVEQGRIDGAENNIPSYQSNGDYSIAPYYILDKHTMVPEILIASKKVLDRLDPHEVAVIKRVAKQTQEYEIEKWKQREVESERIAKSNGSSIVELSPSAVEEFRKAMEPVYHKHGSKYTGVLSQIRSME